MATEKQADTQTVVIRLREAISKGEMVPNQRLIEQDICAAYGASRATVRAALAELTSEGLVERIQNRGARVRAVPLSEAIEILEVRAALEGMCAGQAACRVTDDERAVLIGFGEDMRRSISAGDFYGYSELNSQLHDSVLEFSRHGTAASIIHRLKGQVVRHQFPLHLRAGGSADSLAEHVEIIEAICAGDADRAESAMKKHLSSVVEALRARNT